MALLEIIAIAKVDAVVAIISLLKRISEQDEEVEDKPHLNEEEEYNPFGM